VLLVKLPILEQQDLKGLEDQQVKWVLLVHLVKLQILELRVLKDLKAQQVK